ncbi:hypothetical protein J3458_003086 [Metarhizium acridum]|uniref:uncharacterized protein n=1 Tax=Metarhizium acridum TaxID=92637 RepID=UPI001C6AC706|nr:hypothetical protein J3458_003086 [Metarhizium acridum]
MLNVEDDESARRKRSEHEPRAKAIRWASSDANMSRELSLRGCCIQRGVDTGLAKKKKKKGLLLQGTLEPGRNSIKENFIKGEDLWAVLFSVVEMTLVLSCWCYRMPRRPWLIFVPKSTNPLPAYFLKLIHLVTHKTILYAVVRPPERMGTRVTNDQDHGTRAFP